LRLRAAGNSEHHRCRNPNKVRSGLHSKYSQKNLKYTTGSKELIS
jgi:hypothetical protein